MNAVDDNLILIEKLKSGDQQAMKDIFLRFHKDVYRLIYRFVQDHQATEDLSQEVFLKIWKKREPLHIRENFGGYIRTMAYHEAMAYFRRTPGLEDSVPIEDKAVVEDGNDILAERELKTRIKGIVDRLPIRCRSVFMLSRYDGKSYKEIAELMDISVKTVENQMVKALKVLRSELQDYLVAVIVMIIIAIFFH